MILLCIKDTSIVEKEIKSVPSKYLQHQLSELQENVSKRESILNLFCLNFLKIKKLSKKRIDHNVQIVMNAKQREEKMISRVLEQIGIILTEGDIYSWQK